MPMIGKIMALSASLGLAGCASYSITPIPAGDVANWGKSGESGYIIYQPGSILSSS